MKDRPETLQGKTYKIRPPTIDAAIYVTINDDEVDGVIRPVEIFINSKHVESISWVVCLSRMLSAALRQPGSFPLYVIEELRNTFDPKGGYMIPKTKGKQAYSVASHIGFILENHCKELGLIK